MQFLPNKILHATCNEIIFCAHRVFKNVSGILIMSYYDWVPSQKIARQVAVGVSHTATCRVALRKVEAASTFSATCNAIFRCETSCKHGVSHEEVFLVTCNATPLRCKLQGKLPRVTWPLDMQILKKKSLRTILLRFPCTDTNSYKY